jgi:hypothetical protein
MGKSIPVVLKNGRRWKKKGDAIQHFKEILSKYAVGSRIIDAQDHSDLAALVHAYDARLSEGVVGKIGSGIAYFEKRIDIDHPGKTSCFFIVRTDGSSIDFSYLRALDCAAEV